AAEHRARREDAARVYAVSQCCQHRDREHVTEGVGARHQPGLGGAEVPQGHEVLRHDCRQRHMGQQIADLPQAHRGNECTPGQRGHWWLISMFIELILTPAYSSIFVEIWKSQTLWPLWRLSPRTIASMCSGCLSKPVPKGWPRAPWPKPSTW